LFGGLFFVGYAEKGPYDAIHVGAAAPKVPSALVEQLASPGRMVIPVGTYSQRLMQVDKDAQGQITQRDLFGVVVRPLFVCLRAVREGSHSWRGSMYRSLTDQHEVFGRARKIVNVLYLYLLPVTRPKMLSYYPRGVNIRQRKT
jgi:Protein-L-isoaspartate(D-aspartate) O-methyltransferase (PCMT)